MKKQRKSKNHTKDIQLPNEKIKKLLAENFYQRSIQKINDLDVTINHLENIFADETYYLAMKIVPLLERKVLYLSYVENLRLNDICRRLKLQKKEIISLRNKGIIHFKNNLATITKVQKIKRKGGGENECN